MCILLILDVGPQSGSVTFAFSILYDVNNLKHHLCVTFFCKRAEYALVFYQSQVFLLWNLLFAFRKYSGFWQTSSLDHMGLSSSSNSPHWGVTAIELSGLALIRKSL